MKPYRLRDTARVDVTATFDYFLELEVHLAEGFQADLLKNLAHIEQYPSTGSPRHSNLWSRGARASKLRFWLFNQLPYAIFYVERDTWIDIVRVLHQASDIPQHLKSKSS
jgi:toxin ParE1/3/4